MSTFVFRRPNTPTATLPLRASRFTVRQIEGKVTRFGLTPDEAVRDVKAANARGGRKGAITRRKKPRLAPIVFVFVLALAGLAEAHPGRTDAQGCHRVLSEFTYRSGKVARVGETHCHRPLDRGMSLDGTETLQDRTDPPTSAPAPLTPTPPAPPIPERRTP